YLKRLPADELKIDRGFVTELAQGNDDAAIISAIIALGKTLDMKIVAEGVESAEQQELLTRLGCNTLQGYLLGRPMTPERLTQEVTDAVGKVVWSCSWTRRKQRTTWAVIVTPPSASLKKAYESPENINHSCASLCSGCGSDSAAGGRHDQQPGAGGRGVQHRS